MRRRALLQLPELLERLEKKCTENGIAVHWAETTDAANEIVLRILQDHEATRRVKGKSMVSEEMHLNHFLADHGVESLETDLGEFIIQLDGETPSHIIVPATHKNKQEIARTFHEKLPGTPYTKVVEELNAIIARKTLRQKFYEGEVGLSGVNMITSPRKSGEKNGPREVHLYGNRRLEGMGVGQPQPGLNAFSTKMAGIFGPVLPRVGPLKAWTHSRTRPVFAKKSLW
jgi:L-lactate utilization protein LutB